MNKKITKQQKRDFVWECVSFKTRKMTKTDIRKMPDEVLDKLINKFEKEFTEWLQQPKLIEYLADCIDPAGKTVGYKVSATNKEEAKAYLKKEGNKVLKIAPKKGNHLCMYCGSIAEGTQKDILCEECRSIFGHYSFYEL